MKLLFHIRSDARLKNGGDYNLLQLFAQSLSERNHCVDIHYDTQPDLKGYDAALTINIDRPYEPYLFVKHALRYKCPVAIYTLHHPYGGFERYLKQGTTGARKVLATIASYQPQRYESLLTWSRVLTGQYKPSVSAIQTCRNLQNKILSSCQAVLTAAPIETQKIKSEIIKDNQVLSKVLADKCHVIPHALASFTVNPTSPRKARTIICPGRIESRKNQIIIAKAAKHFPDFEFIFVGVKNASEARYCQQVERIIDETPNAYYKDGLSLEAYRQLLAQSEYFISASWFEVVSLTEIDGVLSGCKLLVGEQSYLKNYIPSQTQTVVYYDTSDETNFFEKLTQLLQGNQVAASEQTCSDIKSKMSLAAIGESLETIFTNLVKNGQSTLQKAPL